MGIKLTRRELAAGLGAAGLTAMWGPRIARGGGGTRRVFFGMLATETNTFSPMPTGLDSFMEGYIAPGALEDDSSMVFAPLRLAREGADKYDWSVIQGPGSYAAPGGTTPGWVYEKMRDDLLDSLRAAMPVDVVALMLHGAMVAEGYDDCEGDLFRHIRDIVGEDAAVGAAFDAHAHLADDMMRYADILIPCKEYPHTDFVERSQELIDLLAATSSGEIRPVMSHFDCRMIDSFHTPREPMRSFVDSMSALEQAHDDVLSISLFQSFPWSDVPVMGAKMLVITDDNQAKGDRIARELGMELFGLRGKVSQPKLTIDEAIDHALAMERGPVVLADFADNPGGGAPCDSTFILQRLLERGVDNAAFGRMYDPLAVEQAKLWGEGATANIRIGGKLSRMSGEPVDLDVTVMKILLSGDQGVNGEEPSGFEAAWLRGQGIDIVVGDSGGQTFFRADFERLGIPLTERQVVVVKSSQHFYTDFAPIAADVQYVDSPGVLATDLTQLPFSRITRPMWPFDSDPHG